MKVLLILLLAVAILLMGACAESDRTEKTPQVSVNVSAIPKPTIAEEAAPSAAPPTEEPNTFLTSQIEAAEQYRVSTPDAEYYLDTDSPIDFFGGFEWEFLLYREDNETGMTEYLGTTGFSFQLCDRFIYVKSDVLQEDWPVGEMTRVVNLDTGVITPLGRNAYIFIPQTGEYVYYEFEGFNSIYKAKPSLEEPTKFDIKIPDKEEIEAQIGDIDDLRTSITIIKVEDEWIYFGYDVFEFEGPQLYEGHYRLSMDGSRLEKTE